MAKWDVCSQKRKPNPICKLMKRLNEMYSGKTCPIGNLSYDAVPSTVDHIAPVVLPINQISMKVETFLKQFKQF